MKIRNKLQHGKKKSKQYWTLLIDWFLSLSTRSLRGRQLLLVQQQQQGRQIVYKREKKSRNWNTIKTVKVIWRKKFIHIVSNMHAWLYFFPMRRALLHWLHHNYKQSLSRSARLSYSDPKKNYTTDVRSLSIEESSLTASRARLSVHIVFESYLIDIQRISDIGLRFIALRMHVNDLSREYSGSMNQINEFYAAAAAALCLILHKSS